MSLNPPRVDRIKIESDGSGGAVETVVELPMTVPDGVAFDTSGSLYVSMYRPDRIYRLTPSGQLDVLADDFEGTLIAAPTNIAFCGSNRDILLSTNPEDGILPATTWTPPGSPCTTQTSAEGTTRDPDPEPISAQEETPCTISWSATTAVASRMRGRTGGSGRRSSRTSSLGSCGPHRQRSRHIPARVQADRRGLFVALAVGGPRPAQVRTHLRVACGAVDGRVRGAAGRRCCQGAAGRPSTAMPNWASTRRSTRCLGTAP